MSLMPAPGSPRPIASAGTPDQPFEDMVADYMEAGFLDNIVEMLRRNYAPFTLIPHLMNDERSRVRMGAVALIETLADEFPEEISALVPDVARTLQSPVPNVRGDGAYALGIIRDPRGLPFLEAARDEPVEPVRLVIEETITELSQRGVGSTTTEWRRREG